MEDPMSIQWIVLCRVGQFTEFGGGVDITGQHTCLLGPNKPNILTSVTHLFTWSFRNHPNDPITRISAMW
eukprot:12912876-Prorocentrum_lima.AAC.1